MGLGKPRESAGRPSPSPPSFRRYVVGAVSAAAAVGWAAGLATPLFVLGLAGIGICGLLVSAVDDEGRRVPLIVVGALLIFAAILAAANVLGPTSGVTP